MTAFGGDLCKLLMGEVQRLVGVEICAGTENFSDDASFFGVEYFTGDASLAGVDTLVAVGTFTGNAVLLATASFDGVKDLAGMDLGGHGPLLFVC